MPKVEIHFQAVGDELVYQKGKKLADLLKDLNKPVAASAGGGMFPIEKHAQAFGAWTRQLNQGMRELRPALKDYERMLQTGFAGMKWNFPSTATAPAGINWRQLGASALIAPFHPWVAARGIAGSFGGGGAGGGGLAGGLFGGSFFKFEAALIAITAVIQAARFAFHQFSQAIERGTRLFEAAAHVGMVPGRLAGIQGALGAVGISGDQAERLLVRGEYPLKGGGKRIQLGDFILGSGRGVLQAGELQQIKNLVEYINMFGERGAFAFKVMGENAKAAFDVTFAMKNVTREWDALMSEVVATIGPALVAIFGSLEDKIRGLVVAFDFVNKYGLSPLLEIGKVIDEINKLVGNVPKNAPGFKGGFLGQAGSLNAHASAFERMGFAIGTGSAGDYARQTAENTKQTTTLLERILSAPVEGARALHPYSISHNAA